MRNKGYMPQRPFLTLQVKGAISLSAIILLHMRELRKLRVLPADAERYVVPPREYELPEFREGMRSCDSDERYLRSTLHCDIHDPQLVAMADKLGAFRVPDREFAQAAFHLVKEQMMLDERPMDGVGETLRRGTGTCFHLINAFIALCRCAGIRARYKVFAMNMIRTWYDAVIQPDPFIKRWYDSLGYFVLEGEGEVFLDGEWVVANVTPEAEWQAAAGTPVNRLGEDSLGMWYNAVPGTVMRMESIPYGFAAALKVLHIIAPGSMERVNLSILRQKEKGRAIIEEAGGVEAYDRRARQKQGPRSPSLHMSERPQIVFDE
jgi:hypothetical protein